MKVLVSPRLFPGICGILRENGCEILKIPAFPALSDPVSDHPDMLFSRLSDGEILSDARYISRNADFFASEGISGLLPSSVLLGTKYPSDVVFDAVKTKGFIIAKLENTAPELIADAHIRINVRQGYAKCSVLLLDGQAVTADRGLSSALRSVGYETLLISPDGIALPGYDKGFIGGASVYLPEKKKTVFFGNVKAHPDGKKILDFLDKNGYFYDYPEDLPLTDFGGGIIV